VFVGVAPAACEKYFKGARGVICARRGHPIIDELDAIGRAVSSRCSAVRIGQHLNQLLVNMDGLAGKDGGNLIVIGATNAAKGPGPGAFTAGRFDRRNSDFENRT